MILRKFEFRRLNYNGSDSITQNKTLGCMKLKYTEFDD